MTEHYPEQVQLLHDAISRLPSVDAIRSGLESLVGLTPADLSLANYAHLPHAAIRRSGGGLENEVLVQVEFRLRQDAGGWRSCEFLAWFVRDQARGGVNIQLRPFGLPPLAGGVIQLGHTLRLHIDLFCQSDGDDLRPVLAAVERIGRNLNLAIDLYQAAISPTAQDN